MSEVNTYVKIISSVVRAQGQVMGPLALNEARKVPGLVFPISGFENIKISGEPNAVITGLVKQYEKIFGEASVEVCKDAIKEIKPPLVPDQVPEILR
ncbi:MAG: hypothetical protein ABIB98_01785 [bacterium]